MLSRLMGMNQSCSSGPGAAMDQLNDTSDTDTDTLPPSSASSTDLSPECPETNNDMSTNHDADSDDSSSAEYHDFSESSSSTGSTPLSPSSLAGEYGSDVSDSDEIDIANYNDSIYSQMLEDLKALSEMCTASESYAQHVERKLVIAIDQLADQEQEIETLTTQIENAKTATETLQTELEKGKKKTANLKTENISLKKQLEQSGVSGLKKKLNDANRERDAAREEVNKLRLELEMMSNTNTKTSDLSLEQLISRLNKKVGHVTLDCTETDAETESESDEVSVSSGSTSVSNTSASIRGHEQQQQIVTIVIALLVGLKTNLSDLNRRVGETRADHVNDAFTMLLALENRVKETTGRLICDIEACLLSMRKRR